MYEKWRKKNSHNIQIWTLPVLLNYPMQITGKGNTVLYIPVVSAPLLLFIVVVFFVMDDVIPASKWNELLS